MDFVNPSKYFKHLIIENKGYPICVRDGNILTEFSIVQEAAQQIFEYPPDTVVTEEVHRLLPMHPRQIGTLSQGTYSGPILPGMKIIDSIPLFDVDSYYEKDYDQLPKHIKCHRKLKFFISIMACNPERQKGVTILQQLVDGHINAADFCNRISQMYPYFDIHPKTAEFLDDALPSLQPYLQSGELQLDEIK